MFLPDLYETPTLAKRVRQGAVVVLLILAAVFAKPGYERFKVWRSHRLVKEAEMLAGKHQFSEALMRVQAALQLAPSDRGNLRAIARTLSLASRPEALRFWQELVRSPERIPEDRVELVQSALLANRLDIARKHIDMALKESPSNGKVLKSAALYCELTGDHSRAAEFARVYLSQNPQSEEMQFFLARELSRTDQGRIDGKNLLFQIATQNGKFAFAALQTLAGLPGMAESEVQHCLSLAEELRNPGMEGVLLTADLRIRVDPAAKSQIASNLIERYGEAKGEEFASLARWLNREHLFSELTSLLGSRESTFGNQDLLLIYLDTLAALRKWTEVGAILEREKLPLSPVIVELFRARVARELGDNQGAESHWDRVNTLSNDDPSMLPYVAEYAEKSGERDRARQAYKRLTQQAAQARSAYEALIRLAEQEGDTASLERVLGEMVEVYPDDSAVRNDLAYVHLLENQKVSESLEVARKNLRESPSSVASRVTVALGLIRIGDFKGAKALFDESPFAWDTALPGWQAVYVAVIGNLGQTHTAAALAELIPVTRLKPEERALIGTWLKH